MVAKCQLIYRRPYILQIETRITTSQIELKLIK